MIASLLVNAAATYLFGSEPQLIRAVLNTSDVPAGPDPRTISSSFLHLEQGGLNLRNVNDFAWAFLGLAGMDLYDPDVSVSRTVQIPVPRCDKWLDPSCSGNVSWTEHVVTNNKANGLFDLTYLYGVTDADAMRLRAGVDGQLRSSGNGTHLDLDDNGCQFLTGDVRVNDHPAFAAVVTLMMREHNRLARNILNDDPSLHDDEIFTAARRLTIAIFQKIFFYEWTAAVLGGALSPTIEHDADLNVSVSDTFIMAVNSLIGIVSPRVARLDAAAVEVSEMHVPLDKALGNSVQVLGTDVNRVLRGMAMQVHPAAPSDALSYLTNLGFHRDQSASTDPQVTNSPTPPTCKRSISAHGYFSGNDVVARFIAQARILAQNTTHTAPPQQRFFAPQFERLATRDSWSEMTSDTKLQASLARLYGDDAGAVDATVALLLPGGQAMQTAAIKEQLIRARDGDPSFFEHPRLFTEAEYTLIFQTHLSDVLARNTDLTNLPANAFFQRPSAPDIVLLGEGENSEASLPPLPTQRAFSSPQQALGLRLSEQPDSNFRVSWYVEAARSGKLHVHFTIECLHAGWVAIGWRGGKAADADAGKLNHGMWGMDVVYASIESDGNVTVTDRYAMGLTMPGKDVELGGQDDIYGVSGEVKDGVLSISFSRPLSASDAHDAELAGDEIECVFAYSFFGSRRGYHGPSRGFFKTRFLRESDRVSDVARIVVDSITIVLILGVGGLAVFICVYRRSVIVMSSSPKLDLTVLFGAAIVYSAVLPAAQPLSPFACGAWQWLLCLGSSICFGALFAKTWRVKKLFIMRVIQARTIRDPLLFALVAVICAPPTLILVMMQVLDPALPYVSEHPTAHYGVVGECLQNHTYLWLGLFCGYFVLLLLWGLHLSVSIWKLPYDNFNQGKELAAAVYNVTIFVVFCGLASTGVMSKNAELGLRAIALHGTTTVTLILLFSKKVWCVAKRNPGHEQASRSGERTQSLGIPSQYSPKNSAQSTSRWRAKTVGTHQLSHPPCTADPASRNIIAGHSRGVTLDFELDAIDRLDISEECGSPPSTASPPARVSEQILPPEIRAASQ